MTTITASTWRRKLEMEEFSDLKGQRPPLRARVTNTVLADVDWTAPVLPDYHRPGSHKEWTPTGVKLTNSSWLRLDTGKVTPIDVTLTVHGRYRTAAGGPGKMPVKLEFLSCGELSDPRDLRSIRWAGFLYMRTHEGALPAWAYEITDKLPALPPRPWALVMKEALG